MIDLLQSTYEQALELKNSKVFNATAPDELKELFDVRLNSKQGIKVEELEKVVKSIIEHSVNTQNPRFLNQLYGGTQEISWFGEFLTSILNTSMATYEIAPLATLMEKEFVDLIRRKANLGEVEGFMVPGGSYANMMGLHLARYKNNPTLKETGMFTSAPMHVYVSEDAHYSTKKAMGLLGLGRANVKTIPVTNERKMCVSALKDAIETTLKEKCIPLCVIATAGTTVWGAFDPISEISAVCKQYDTWLHVDAAWGGFALWSQSKNQLFTGIEHIDSMTIDFHKIMSSSITKAFFISTHIELLQQSNLEGGHQYLFHAQETEEIYDLGKMTFQCGRKVDSLALWLQWKFYGEDNFSTRINTLLTLKDWCKNYLLNNSERYQLLHDPEYLNICFKVKVDTESKLSSDQVNLRLREEILKDGTFMVNYSKNQEHGTFIRLVLNHWEVQQNILEELFTKIEVLTQNILSDAQ